MVEDFTFRDDNGGMFTVPPAEILKNGNRSVEGFLVIMYHRDSS